MADKGYLYDIGLFIMENEYQAMALHMSDQLRIFGHTVKVIHLPEDCSGEVNTKLCDFIKNGCAYQVFFISKRFSKCQLALTLADLSASISREYGVVRAAAVELDERLPVGFGLNLYTIRGDHSSSLEAAREINLLMVRGKEQEERNHKSEEKSDVKIVMADKISHSKFF